jgi:hypothetical protein
LSKTSVEAFSPIEFTTVMKVCRDLDKKGSLNLGPIEIMDLANRSSFCTTFISSLQILNALSAEYRPTMTSGTIDK